MYHYRLYGVNFQSDIPLYNLSQTPGEPEVFITYGIISYENIPKGSEKFYYTKDYVCFHTADCALSISGGSRITIEPIVDTTPIRLASYVLGWGLAILFTQRNFSALHGTALDINGSGIIISGCSGAGKSTTALALIRRGYQYLADDIVMMNPLDNMDILPAYPLQKVCHDIADSISRDKLQYISEVRDKYAYHNVADFCPYPRILKTIFLLRCADVPSVQMEEMTGLRKYLCTLECLFLSEIYAANVSCDADKFRCLKLAEQIRLVKITRPLHGDSLTEIVDKIENWIQM